MQIILNGDDEKQHKERDNRQKVTRHLVQINTHRLFQIFVPFERIDEQHNRNKIQGQKQNDVHGANKANVDIAQGQKTIKQRFYSSDGETRRVFKR